MTNNFKKTASAFNSLNKEIAARKQMELLLQKESYLRNVLLDNIPCIAMILKKGTRVIVASNEAARKIGAVTGETCFRTCTKRDSACPFCLAPEVWSDNKPRSVEVEYEGTYYKGIWVPFTENLYVHYIFDITNSKKTERGLKESVRRFRETLENLHLIAVQFDTEGVITYANNFLLSLTGWTHKEILGEDWFDIFVPDGTRDEIKQMHHNNISKHEVSIHYENEIKTRTGKKRLISWNISHLYGTDGEIIGITSIGEDITERKNLETQLIRLHKMEALGQLARGVAHDYNNIFTALAGYGNILQMKIKKKSPLVHNINQMLILIERATGLTKNLFALSKGHMIELETVDVNESVRKAEEIISRIINSKVRLKTLYSDIDLTVMADNGQMEQVLINISNNASDAMPDGGLLTIETKQVEINSDFINTHGYGKEGKYALISLSDSGTGMDEKTREKVFKLFFTTKEVGKGIGLGLSIVYEIIKKYGGYVNILSEQGKGTTVNVYIPIVEQAVEKKENIDVAGLIGGAETVLVAEDEAGVRENIKTVLKEFGYKVIEASDGKEAIEKFRQDKDKIQLALLDVVMPKLNGIEVYLQIRDIRPDIRALFISGYPRDSIYVRGIFEEGLNFISKPVSPQDLLQKVREVLVN